MSRPHLVSLPYSPWSLKAKWALDHHRVAYRLGTHLPMLGEPLLRLRTGRWSGKVSVPILIADGEAIMGSDAIARWADAHGEGEPLFPEGEDEAVAHWNGIADELLDAGRARVIERSLASREALIESVPGPRFLGPLLVPVGKMGARFLARKYGADQAGGRDVVERGLAALREALDGDAHLVGDRFTFADIAMAAALACVRPPGRSWDHLGDASRACWTDDALAEQHEELLAWRDHLFAERFPPRVR